MKKIHSFSVSALIILFFFQFSLKIFAQTPIPTPSPQSSYELFYPVVAGKTEGEPFYFLKLIRDSLSEWLTSSNREKSMSSLRLATKRFLEAEKLFKQGKNNLAEKALNRFTTKLNNSYEYALKEKEQNSLPRLFQSINQETQKYRIILDQLLDQTTEDERIIISQTLQKVGEISSKAQQEIEED